MFKVVKDCDQRFLKWVCKAFKATRKNFKVILLHASGANEEIINLDGVNFRTNKSNLVHNPEQCREFVVCLDRIYFLFR